MVRVCMFLGLRELLFIYREASFGSNTEDWSQSDCCTFTESCVDA